MPTVPFTHPNVGKKTDVRCHSCSAAHSDSWMHVKQVIDTTTVLECPNCEALQYMHTNTVRFA